MNGIAYLPIKDGSFTVVDSDLFQVLNQHVWARNKSGYCYRYQRAPSGRFQMIHLHREVNKTPAGKFTDHINSDINDNRRSNLRTATKSQNAANWVKFAENPETSSRYRGVSFHSPSGLWKVCLRHQGKEISLGYWKTQEAAAYTYNDEVVKRFGEFARPNKPLLSREEAFALEPTYSSQYRGVTYLKKQEGKRNKLWRARIETDGARYNKYFATEREAAEGYNVMARQYHGENAVLNQL